MSRRVWGQRIICTRNDSDKFYEIEVVERITGEIAVNFRHGPRGTSRTSPTRTKDVYDSVHEAIRAAVKVINQKLRKGYVTEHALPTDKPLAPQPPDKPLAPQPLVPPTRIDCASIRGLEGQRRGFTLAL